MTASAVIRVVIADDHTLVRSGLRALLEQIPCIDVVAEAADGAAAVDAVAALSPDVAILDISMPVLSGLEAARRIVSECPMTHVLMLTVHRNEEYVMQALRVGALGYVLKGAEVAEFDLAIRAVARGESYLTAAVSKQVVDDYVERVTGGATQGGLTPRQRDVLRLIASGASTKQAAAALGLSTKTIEAHRAQVMDRLQIRDLPGLVRYALRTGLIADEG